MIKQPLKRVAVDMTPDLHRKLTVLAERDAQTLSGWLKTMVAKQHAELENTRTKSTSKVQLRKDAERERKRHLKLYGRSNELRPIHKGLSLQWTRTYDANGEWIITRSGEKLASLGDAFTDYSLADVETWVDEYLGEA